MNRLGWRVGAGLAALSTLALAGCRKESTSPVLVAAGNTTLGMNGTITSAVTGSTFSFPGGAGVLAAAVAGDNLALTFAGSSGSPTATASFTTAGGASDGSFTANVTFGSCIFTVTGVTGTSKWTVGQVVRVDPCNLNVGTAGAQANGQGTSRAVALVLGIASSANVPITVGVNPGGGLTLNGTIVGTVTLTPGTGS